MIEYTLKYRKDFKGKLTVEKFTDIQEDLTIEQALSKYDLKFKTDVVDATISFTKLEVKA